MTSREAPLDLCLLGGASPESVTISSTAKKGYIADAGADRLLIFSTASNMMIGAVPLPGVSKQVAFSRDGVSAYVASGRSTASVSVIDTATDAVIKTFAIPASEPQDIAISPSGAIAYVTIRDAGQLLVIDTVNGSVTASIKMSGHSLAHTDRIAVAPDGARVYVTTSDMVGATLSMVDASAHVVLSKVAFRTNSRTASRLVQTGPQSLLRSSAIPVS